MRYICYIPFTEARLWSRRAEANGAPELLALDSLKVPNVDSGMGL